MKRLFRIIIILLVVMPAPAIASELRFNFVNPSFGGNPMNGQWLLNTAAAQNDFRHTPAPRMPTPRMPDPGLREVTDLLRDVRQLIIKMNIQIGDNNIQ